MCKGGLDGTKEDRREEKRSVATTNNKMKRARGIISNYELLALTCCDSDERKDETESIFSEKIPKNKNKNE